MSATSQFSRKVLVKTNPTPSLSFGLERLIPSTGVHPFIVKGQKMFPTQLHRLPGVDALPPDFLPVHLNAAQDSRLYDYKTKWVTSSSSLTSLLALMATSLFPVIQQKINFYSHLRRHVQIQLKRHGESISVTKVSDGGSTILCQMGHILEYRLTHSDQQFQQLEREEGESHLFSLYNDWLIRSQLDAQLTGKELTFDIKTRACAHIRYKLPKAWVINFDREYVDLVKGPLLSYAFQAYLGFMGGIFVAFHDLEKFHGFQYLSLEEMAQHYCHPEFFSKLFGLSLNTLSIILDQILLLEPCDKTVNIYFIPDPYEYGPFIVLFGTGELSEMHHVTVDFENDFLQSVIDSPTHVSTRVVVSEKEPFKTLSQKVVAKLKRENAIVFT